MKSLRNNFLIHTNFLTTTISLFYCCEKVFILMNIWMTGKNSTKHHYHKNKIFSHLNMENITDAHYVHAKRVCKDFEIKKI